jgi:phospholipase C
MRGALIEGRCIVFELSGFALENSGNPSDGFSAGKASASHSDINKRWVVHNLV